MSQPGGHKTWDALCKGSGLVRTVELCAHHETVGGMCTNMVMEMYFARKPELARQLRLSQSERLDNSCSIEVQRENIAIHLYSSIMSAAAMLALEGVACVVSVRAHTIRKQAKTN